MVVSRVIIIETVNIIIKDVLIAYDKVLFQQTE